MKIFPSIIALSVAVVSLTGCVIASDNSKTEVIAAPMIANKSLVSSNAETLKAQPSGAYVSDPKHTSLTWRIGHMGISQYTARFDKVNADLEFDSQNPTKSSVSAQIDVNSVNTGIATFDKEISEEFFLSQPISFTSTNLVQTSATTGKLTGNLSFRGITKPVTLDVTFNGGIIHPFMKKPAIGFAAHGILKRSEFGLDKYIPMITDDVEIIIESEFFKK